MNKFFDSILIFGEVLFDVFPEGNRVLGGAPFNVASHLKGFGLDPVFISRIGNDEAGRKVVRNMEARSLAMSGLQKDDDKMTGEVMVKINNDEPSYDIREGVAYDYIEMPDPELIHPEHSRLLYHGTLAARNQVSASTLYKLAQNRNTSVFCDINLRDPWYTTELVRNILGWCEYLKVNEEELGQVCSLEDIDASAELEQKGEILRKKRDLKCLVVTLGSKGAMLFPEGHEYLFASSPEVQAFQDSVGAGDAFCSVFMLGIAQGWPWELILERAVFFAARICENQGAVPDDNKFYDRAIESWEHENA